MTAAPNNKPNVLLLVDRRQSRTARLLKTSGYNISTTYTPDHAVAICVNNRIDAVVLDQQHFIETEGWSVAKSLKMIRGTVCVILVVRGRILSHSFPAGVDAIVPEHDDEALVQTLERLLRRAGDLAAD
jgi:response regulator RpfG family c-di-GMP phosphodiesterase